MIIGFTGTRNGMTPPQRATVEKVVAKLLFDFGAHEAHHGDCVGADAEFSDIAFPLAAIHVRPGPDGPLRAHKGAAVYYPEKTHFARNRDIVKGCDLLLATPRLMTEEDRGGTWYTINFARKVGKPIIIVWPDGSELRERLTSPARSPGRMG